MWCLETLRGRVGRREGVHTRFATCNESKTTNGLNHIILLLDFGLTQTHSNFFSSILLFNREKEHFHKSNQQANQPSFSKGRAHHSPCSRRSGNSYFHSLWYGLWKPECKTLGTKTKHYSLNDTSLQLVSRCPQLITQSEIPADIWVYSIFQYPHVA